MKFKSKFTVPTKDLKSNESVYLDVFLPDAEDLKDINEIEFKVHIPDFMFDELKDTEQMFSTKKDSDEKVSTHETRKRSGCFANRDCYNKEKNIY